MNKCSLKNKVKMMIDNLGYQSEKIRYNEYNKRK